MEELGSTEALDREILEDARRKADRILKTADQTLRTIQEQWNEKTRSALSDLEQLYRQRTEKAEGEIMARLPLDERRIRCEWAEGQLQKAAASFCASLSRDRILSVMRQDFEKKVAAVSELAGFLDAGETMGISVQGLLKEEAEELLNTAMVNMKRSYAPDCSWSQEVLYPEIICENTSLRLVISFKALVDQLLLDRRAELAVALLGKGVTND